VHSLLWKIFCPSLEICVGHSLKNLGPLSKLFAASPGVPIWLGPASYACYSSTIMLWSKIIKQTIDYFFQFDLDKLQNHLWKDTFALVGPRLKGHGFSATVLRRCCLQLSAVTVSLHYLLRCLLSRVTCNKRPNIVTWTENLKICCHVIITR